ncbi:MAG: hypothetical protein H7172_03135 [Ferruginibacter sp.]|nr:hypothetical protein [Rhodoferax sp.]
MNRLQAELHRLYRSSNANGDDAGSEDFGFVSPNGGVRAMVLELARPADWHALSALWQGVQADLQFPAPAIAVSGVDGYQLWFSLSEPVPAVEAQNLLECLRLRYLGNIALGRIAMWPSVGASTSGNIQHAKAVPALKEETGRWSAFIAPDLAAVFSDEPGLDVCPSPDAQADVLSRLKSIKAIDFQMVLGQLSAAAKIALAHPASPTTETGSSTSTPQNLGGATAGNSTNPKRFLLNVMGDPSIQMHLRIEAAQALLPYFEIRRTD